MGHFLSVPRGHVYLLALFSGVATWSETNHASSRLDFPAHRPINSGSGVSWQSPARRVWCWSCSAAVLRRPGRDVAQDAESSRRGMMHAEAAHRSRLQSTCRAAAGSGCGVPCLRALLGRDACFPRGREPAASTVYQAMRCVCRPRGVDGKCGHSDWRLRAVLALLRLRGRGRRRKPATPARVSSFPVLIYQTTASEAVAYLIALPALAISREQ